MTNLAVTTRSRRTDERTYFARMRY